MLLYFFFLGMVRYIDKIKYVIKNNRLLVLLKNIFMFKNYRLFYKFGDLFFDCCFLEF